MRVRSYNEAGFTLVELLISVVIIGVITVPLGDVVISALKHTDSTSDRMDLSHDAQVSSSYFARDVAAVGVRDYDNISGQSVAFKQSVQLDAAYNAGGHTCGTAATPTAVVRLLADAWDTTQNPAEQHTDVVAYYVKPGGELHRIKCTASGTSDIVVAHHITSAAVSCSSTCEATAVPGHITLRLTASKPSVGDYPITLNGQRRQS